MNGQTNNKYSQNEKDTPKSSTNCFEKIDFRISNFETQIDPPCFNTWIPFEARFFPLAKVLRRSLEWRGGSVFCCFAELLFSIFVDAK